MYQMFLLLILSKGLLTASDLSVDPQREDTDLQEERTHDIQFEEDKDLQQEKSHSFQIDPH